MVRIITWTAIILVCGLLSAATEGRSVNRRPRRTTTTTAQPTVLPTDGPSEEVDSTLEADDDRHYHPAEVTEPRVLEQVDRRFLDGNFEYKYVLSNGVSRYEKSYWIPAGKSKALARKGFYSYPMPNRKFLTVFYTADDKGYHQDSATYSQKAPTLPRSLNVPQFKFPDAISTTSTTRKPKQKKPTRRPQQL